MVAVHPSNFFKPMAIDKMPPTNDNDSHLDDVRPSTHETTKNLATIFLFCHWPRTGGDAG